jgi:hypothetical protein
MFMTFQQNSYYQRKVGTLDESQAGAIDTLPLLDITPYYRKLWEEGIVKDESFSKEFVDHANKIIEQANT